jgi:MFS family permease
VSSAARIPGSIWVLGLVSLLMDISSELIHSLLPVFMVSSLGASVFVVGIIEGVAEATALIVRVFSGALSDYLGRRKALAVIGYGLGAASKPMFALASSVSWVFAARFMDRIGKGIRGSRISPRRRSAGRPTGCASPWIPSVHSWVPCWV